MEFIRKILIIDKSLDEALLVKEAIVKKSHKFSVFTLKSRHNLAETVSKNEIRFLFLNANIGKNDVIYVLRYFSILQDKQDKKTTIFFASEDYNLLQEILNDFPAMNLQILHTPIDRDDVAEKIYMSAFGVASTGLEKSKQKKSVLDVDLEFMNIFITNTRKVIAEMTQIEDLVHSAPLLMSQVHEPLHIAISAKIVISSVYFKGSYYISFPEESFFNFYEKVVMEKCVAINDENKDFTAELANIIYGQCKKIFSELGYNLDMVIPSTHLGDINFPVVILIPFTSPLGKFYIAVAPGLI